MEFISVQISRYRVRLEELRREMARFQQEHGMIDFEEQVRGAVDVAANLKVRAILAKIELDLLREFTTRDANELRRKEIEYRQLNEQLQGVVEGDTSAVVFVPFKRLPELHQRFAAMQRDLDVNERVYSFLTERYEESGIERARTTPTVQVVDRPNIPQKPSGLPRWSIVLIVGLIGFVWITVVLTWWNWLSLKQRTDDERRAYEEVLGVVRDDLGKLRRFLRL
jgi:capsule polysaccharide export protein KpsE/RkpR